MPLGFVMASGASGVINFSPISEGIIPVIPDNVVIQNGHIQDNTPFFDPFTDLLVRIAGLNISFMMVVTLDNTVFIIYQANDDLRSLCPSKVLVECYSRRFWRTTLLIRHKVIAKFPL